MKAKILYLPIETVVRELDGNLLLTYEALKRGYAVIIGRIKETRDFAKKIDNGIFILKTGEISFLSEKQRNNYYLIGFHPEGLVFTNKNALTKTLLGDNAESLDMIFVNGLEQKKILIEKKPEIENKIRVVGNPRFDILRPEFRYIFNERVKKIKKKYGKYFLINTNFTRGNPSPMYGKDFITFLEKLHKRSYNREFTKKEYSNIVKRIKYNKKLFLYYKEMITFLSKEFPEINFILRPHPSENHENWRKIFKNLKNVKVVFEGNVVNWILGAKAIIHTGCTTGIEAWAAEKPVINYNPVVETSPFKSELPNKFGRYASSPEEIKEILKSILEEKGKNDFENQVSIARPFIESIQGELSVIKIMDILDREVNFSEINLESKIANYPLIKDKIISFLKKARRAILTKSECTKFFLGKKKAIEISSKFQKFLPGVRKKYVVNFLKKITEKNGTEKIFIVKEIGADTYFIKLKNDN